MYTAHFLPQLSSSDRSTQSNPPSHFQLPWMHSPLPQRNSMEEHWCAGTLSGLGDPQLLGHSSEPSEQSASPSQAHRRGKHTVLLHWKDAALQVTAGHDASSLPSSQSASSSHTKEADTHWPLPQRNSVLGHCLDAGRVEDTGGEGKFGVGKRCCTINRQEKKRKKIAISIHTCSYLISKWKQFFIRGI